MVNAPRAVAWSEVLRRNDLVDGAIELCNGERVARAPIVKIHLVGSICTILIGRITEWTESGARQCHNEDHCRLDVNESPAFDIGSGIISFFIPGVGAGLIYPRGKRPPSVGAVPKSLAFIN